MFSFNNILTTLLTLTSLAHSSPVAFRASADQPQTPLAPVCDCTGTLNGLDHTYICGDNLLGLTQRPNSTAVRELTVHYDRFAGLEPGAFLARWLNRTLVDKVGKPRRGWAWPEKDGWLLDDTNKPIMANKTLEPGTRLDRFGYEGGKYLGAADAPYAQRALPPDSLSDENYHLYEVVMNLTLPAGPIRPWFGQPGMGTQFFTGHIGNISVLVEKGYLRRLDAAAPRIVGC